MQDALGCARWLSLFVCLGYAFQLIGLFGWVSWATHSIESFFTLCYSSFIEWLLRWAEWKKNKKISGSLYIGAWVNKWCVCGGETPDVSLPNPLILAQGHLTKIMFISEKFMKLVFKLILQGLIWIWESESSLGVFDLQIASALALNGSDCGAVFRSAKTSWNTVRG